MAEIEPIWDYYLPNDGEALSSEESGPLTNYEFNFVPVIAFGGSEGIYVDLYLDGDCDGSGFKRTEIGVFKTLHTDLDACRLMGQLCGVLMYHGSAYVNENIHRYTAELGYYIGEPYWGRGITTAAVRAACAWLFANTDLVRLYAEPFARNRASCRVLEKAGFTLEGRLRQNAVKNGKSEDMMLYSLLREEWGRQA